jgi:hypothetical protein
MRFLCIVHRFASSAVDLSAQVELAKQPAGSKFYTIQMNSISPEEAVSLEEESIGVMPPTGHGMTETCTVHNAA